jgi:hypothetical protein
MVLLTLIAVKASAGVIDLPFGRKVDTTLLEAAAAAKTPEAMVKLIKAQNIEVYKVSREGETASGFAFAFLKEAPAELRPQLEDGSRATMLSKNDLDVSVKTETILVDTSVEPYHLLHEVFHALATRSQTAAQNREEDEATKAQYGIERRFRVYWDKIYRDFGYRTDDHWRKDFLGYITDYADASLVFFKYKYAEEIAADWYVTKLLSEKKSPYLTEKTLADATEYSKSNYRSITVRVDDVYFVMNWVLQTMYGNAEDTGLEVPMSEKFAATEQFNKIKSAYTKVRPDFDRLKAMAEEVGATYVPESK